VRIPVFRTPGTGFMECIFRNKSNTVRRTDISMIKKPGTPADFLQLSGTLPFLAAYRRK
jgi:hypothetical protein